MGIKVGIDLGTTFCAVARLNEKKGQPEIILNSSGERITPSVIQFFEDSSIVVGSEAKEAFEAGEYGCACAFKRGMGSQEVYCSFYGKDYTSEDLSAILLRYLKEEAERVTGERVDEAVVTVPAYFYHKERQATMNAARKAGLKIRQIINEPTAAAMNFGVNHWRENARILVYDLGGGTFDVTLIQMKKTGRMESLQTTGDHTLGGKDWDDRITMLVQQKIESDTGLTVEEYPEIRQNVVQCAERIKIQLTTRNTATATIRIPDYGKYSVSVTLEEFDQSTKDLIERTGMLCESLLGTAHLGWSDVTDILLVGGSTRMRQVSTYLKRLSGRTPLSQVNPDEAVALGAAIQVHLPLPAYVSIDPFAEEEPQQSSRQYLFHKQGKKMTAVGGQSGSVPIVIGKEIQLGNALCIARDGDVVAHAMGVIAVNKEGTRYINKTIIPANQTIPAKCAEAFHYYTSRNGDNEVEIYVLQGSKAPLECEIIGKYVVSGITHNSADNPTTIRIQYSYDVNGLVHVQARQGKAVVDLPIKEEPVPTDMSKFGRPIDPSELKPVVEPLYLVMAVDVSGSMSGKPMKDALDAMCHFVDQFEDYPGDVQIGAIAVSDRSLIVQHLTSDLKKCKASIRSIRECMTGVCNEGHPFGDIKNELAGKPGKCFGIVLADGMWENQGNAVSAARQCHRAGIDITGIGFGSADERFLRDISSGDVRSMMVQQAELTQSFGKIAQEIGGVKAAQHGRSMGKGGTETWLATDE